MWSITVVGTAWQRGNPWHRKYRFFVHCNRICNCQFLIGFRLFKFQKFTPGVYVSVIDTWERILLAASERKMLALLSENDGLVLAILAITVTCLCIYCGSTPWRQSPSRKQKVEATDKNDRQKVPSVQPKSAPNSVKRAEKAAQQDNRTYNLRILYGTQTGTARRKLLFISLTEWQIDR